VGTEIRPFVPEVTAEDLDDLRQRLRRTRWPEAEPVTDWSQGVPLAELQELCRYWAEEYDWAARSARMNGFPAYLTEIDGLDIHFLHVPSPIPGALPLVLTHGWPGSVVEFLEVIGPLTDPAAHGGDPADAFSVVCPSLPGYGWSAKPTGTGWGVERIGRAWAELMARLGYQRYGAQGGDWGAAVTRAIALQDPSHVAGIHLNMVSVPPVLDDGEPTVAEQAAIAALKHYREWDSGYSTEQATRPQTVGYGLVDSPAGLAGWILEKFWAWSDADGHPVQVLGPDRILDNLMLYWLPGTGASSARLYWESFRRRTGEQITVPVGATVFPKDIFTASRRWAEHVFTDLRYWSEPDHGGHFAAFEVPELFVDEVRASFRTCR
jgi:pimeloyl-ACP methyl ester carboxylesterase